MQPVIECQHVTKQFGEGANIFTALRGIDLTIYAGELFMLVGPSGCGKTTLISIMAGILDPTSGICNVLSHNMKNLSSQQKTAFRSKNIGFVFQAFNLLPSLTATENVAIPLIINNVPWNIARKKAIQLLEQVELGNRINSFPSQLSGGQQQRVAIARALITEPKIIVCDEPTSSLDHHTGEKVIKLMQNMSKHYGVTLVVVTHDNRIFNYADRIGKMNDGIISAVEVNESQT